MPSSNVATHTLNKPEAELLLYPNPAKDQVNIALKSPNSGVISIQVCDISGQMVYADKAVITSGILVQTLNLKGLKEGVYVVRLLNDAGEVLGLEPLVIQR